MSSFMPSGAEQEVWTEHLNNLRIRDLGPGLLAHVLTFLNVQDICRATESCRAFYEASLDDRVWHFKAFEHYPASTVLLGETYPSYKALLKDDNAQNTSLIIPLRDTSCDYRFNRHDYFFECCVTSLEWNRSTDTLRLFFDARGEPDLRSPVASSLGVVVHRDHPNRREIRAAISSVYAQRRELRAVVEQLEPDKMKNELCAMRHIDALTALNAASYRLTQLLREFKAATTPSFSDLLTVLRPTGHHFLVSEPGHVKGCLNFSGISQIDELRAELPSDWRLKREISQHGMDIIFCACNPVPVMPQEYMVDYFPARVMHVSPGSTFARAVVDCGRYAECEELMNRMKGENPMDERVRWQHVEMEFEGASRQFSNWYVE